MYVVGYRGLKTRLQNMLCVCAEGGGGAISTIYSRSKHLGTLAISAIRHIVSSIICLSNLLYCIRLLSQQTAKKQQQQTG